MENLNRENQAGPNSTAMEPDFEITTIPVAQFLTLAGAGSPDAFAEYAEALRATARALGQEVGPLEALWWTEDGSEMHPEAVGKWRWKVMVMLPAHVYESQFEKVLGKTRRAKKNNELLKHLRLETIEEGEVVQTLHTGPLNDKQSELDAMVEYALDRGYMLQGHYHEIYFDDPGPGSPPDAKTILRQPLRG